MDTINLEFGQWAEDYAIKYLEDKGYEVLDKNYSKPWGEIDIVAKKNEILIFVEVKANKNEIAGFEPENRVNSKKLQRLHRAIQTYLSSKKYDSSQEWQIDIVALTLNRDRGVVKIKHFKNVDL